MCTETKTIFDDQIAAKQRSTWWLDVIKITNQTGGREVLKKCPKQSHPSLTLFVWLLWGFISYRGIRCLFSSHQKGSPSICCLRQSRIMFPRLKGAFCISLMNSWDYIGVTSCLAFPGFNPEKSKKEKKILTGQWWHMPLISEEVGRSL